MGLRPWDACRRISCSLTLRAMRQSPAVRPLQPAYLKECPRSWRSGDCHSVSNERSRLFAAHVDLWPLPHKPLRSEAPMEDNADDDDVRVSTGNAGLDNILGGSLDAERIYLYEGRPGTGKTTLALEFL